MARYLVLIDPACWSGSRINASVSDGDTRLTHDEDDHELLSVLYLLAIVSRMIEEGSALEHSRRFTV